MLPIKITYPSDLVREYKKFSLPLRNFIVDNDTSEWGYQKDLSLSLEYKQYKEKLESMRFDIIQCFSGICLYCLNNAETILPIHPIEKNPECPDLCMDISNIYAICSSCSKRLVVDYSMSRLDLGRKLTTIDLIQKIPNILLPTFEPTHKYLQDSLKYSNFYNNLVEHLRDAADLSNKEVRLLHTVEILNLDYAQNALTFYEKNNNQEKATFNELYKTLWESKNYIKIGARNFDADLEFANRLKVPALMKKKFGHDTDFLGFGLGYYKPRKILKKVTFKNLRCFDNIEIDLSNKNVLCLIGDNGTGKSTFLNSISLLGASSFRKELKRSKDHFSFDKRESTFIDLYYEDIKRNDDSTLVSHIKLNKKKDSFPSQNQQIPICFINEKRTGTQFLPKFKMELKKEKNFKEVVKIFSHVLNLGNDEGLIERNGNVFLKRQGSEPIDLFETSSGARSIFYIIYSILKNFPHYKRGSSPDGCVFGCVLIDEIELHLHPKWKIGIVSKFKEMYPDILFIVTTHDPLVLHGLDSSEIAVIEKSKKQKFKSIFNNDLPDIENYTVDLILTSPYFGLSNAGNYTSKKLDSQNNKYFESYREKLINEIYNRSLELNLKYTNEELSLLVAENFTRE